MKKYIILLITVISFSSCDNKIEKLVYVADKWENPEWENPEIFQINREEPTASFFKYDNEKLF